MSSKIKFGTDGWRAIISDDFTFENVRIVAQAIADFVKSQKAPIYRKKKIVVGYDTRFLSDKYAEIISLVLAANGIKVVLSDRPATTPSVCVYIKDQKLTGGVMVTASHNPASYNGIKYKGFFAGSAGSDIIDKIEAKLYKSKVKIMALDEALKTKKVQKEDIVKLQLDYILKYADMEKLDRCEFKVLVDSMNGTGGTYLKDILRDSKIKLDFINAEINPGFKGKAPEPNEKNLKELTNKVVEGGYDLGIATDGDSDRLAIADEKGRIISGHKLMALLLLHFLKHRKMTGGVIQTICGTGLINKICGEYKLPIYETPVGFKYICELMTKKDILVGGEETGGIGFKGYVPERDGFLSALLMVELLASEGKSLSRILEEVDDKYGTYVYEREDIVFPAEKRGKLTAGMKKRRLDNVCGKKVVEIKDYDGTKYICGDGSWLLIRASGTEPKLRIYSETPSKKESLEYIEFGRKYLSSLI